MLRHVWLGLGRNLLLASGAAADELTAAAEDDEEEGDEGREHAAGSTSSRALPGIYRDMGLARDGERVEVSKRFLWARYSTTLFCTFTWLQGEPGS